jgi:phage gpG-like protein
MAGILNLAEAAARFAAAAADIDPAKRAALEESCRMVEDRAKGLIGHPNGHWPPLAPETIARKGGLNMPLLETGEMRESIEHTVVDSNHGYVGSNNDKAVWQELGTSRGIPPRPFLGLAADLEGPAVEKVVARTLGGAIGGGLAGSRVHEFFELAHVVGEALRPIKESAEDLLSPDDERRR